MNVGGRIAVGHPDARKGKLPQRVTGKHRNALRVGGVVFLQRRIERDFLPQLDAQLLGLVIVELVGENREAGGDGPVEKIWFGETELNVALEAADLSG